MNTQDTRSDRFNENEKESVKSKDPSLSNCCGTDMFEKGEMEKECPCAGLMKGSKKAFVGFLAGAGLLFSITVTGWVLGVVAFLRTL